MSWVDDLFGGTDDSNVSAVIEDNASRRAQADQMYRYGVGDTRYYMPKAKESVREGYHGAIATLRRTPQAQIRALQGAGQVAAQALLGGMGAYQNAILGLPTGISQAYYQNPKGLTPRVVASGSRPTVPFTETYVPKIFTEDEPKGWMWHVQDKVRMDPRIPLQPNAMALALMGSLGMWDQLPVHARRSGQDYDWARTFRGRSY